ncbi:MAG: hypothetical protein V3S29_00460, partial [bacterium]
TIVGAILIGVPGGAAAYEVWVIDQSDSKDGTTLGGNLYVFSGTDDQFSNGAASVKQYNLTSEAKKAGFRGGKKPHMAIFNTGATHLIVSHASSGHVYAVDAETRQVVDEIAPGGNSHAAVPSPDNSYVLVGDIGGQKVHKVATNYNGGKGNIFGRVSTLDLKASGVPGAIRAKSAKPICPVVESSSRFAYVTLAAGGLVIVDTRSMKVAHTFSTRAIGANGCGGVQIGDMMFINSGNANPQRGDFIYAFDNGALLANPSKRPPLKTVPVGGHDSHGMTHVGRFLWTANRASNTIEVYDTSRSPFRSQADPANPIPLVNLIALAGGGLGSDPAPDLIDASPSGELVFISQRGPLPKSANSKKFQNAKGSSPGLGVIRVAEGGRIRRADHHYPLGHRVGGKELADFHALRVRK